jgi:hypothetical protein
MLAHLTTPRGETQPARASTADLPPPHARASVHRGQQLLRCGPPAGAGVKDPCGRPGSRSLHLGKIKGSLVKPGPRRLQRRMTRRIHPPRVVHHDSAHGGHGAPSARHDVDRAALPGLQESVQFGSGLMAQHGARPRSEHRSPKLRLAGQRAAIGRVDASMEALPAPARQPGVDRVAGQSRGHGLSTRDDPSLATNQPTGFLWQLRLHASTVAAAARAMPPQISRTCG